MRRFVIAAGALLASACGAMAEAPGEALGARLCTGISGSVAELGGPGFVLSYRPAKDERKLPPPLGTSAFTYDNALALIAALACDDLEGARKIGEAFRSVIASDRRFSDGRVRNAYRAGRAVSGEAALLPGWWDSGSEAWAEDAYQIGTATGNVAWAALALLNLHQLTGEAWALQDAERLAGWVGAMSGGSGPPGYRGGVHGHDAEQSVLPWKSTEHHADIAAMAHWLHRLTGKPVYEDMYRTARSFLDAMFDKEAGVFRMGTEPDGRLAPASRIAMDAQVWPLIAVPEPAQQWKAALDSIEQHLAVPGGYDFNDDRDGLWTEGTAQAALVQRVVGRDSKAAEVLGRLSSLVGPNGWMRATNVARLTTGLAIGPDSTSNDFFYFPRPHLGATAWAVLAERGWNPFNGQRVE
jgi:hypothetical protein